MMLLQESEAVNKTLDLDEQFDFDWIYDGSRERNSEYQEVPVAKTMISEGGPVGGTIF